jgi:hypothetical protein
MLLAAFMIGSIGVLDDVTVTQAAAVEELGRHGLRGRQLFAGAFNVGRSHIAATVNTLFLAYAGASLPLLVFLVVGNQPTALLVNGEAISIEIVRTLVGSLGIVAAVPLTTVIAAWLASADGTPEGAGVVGATATDGIDRAHPRRPGLAVALGGGLALIAAVTLVAAAVVGPLTATGPRTAVAPERFGSQPPTAGGSAATSASPASSSPSSSSLGPGSSSNDTPIFAVGDAIPLVGDSGETDAEVTIAQVDPQGVTPDGGTIFEVELRYHASRPVALDPTVWVARSSSGKEVTADGTPSAGRPALAAGPLAAGQVRTGWLRFTLPDAPDSLSLDYRRFGGTLFSVLVY